MQCSAGLALAVFAALAAVPAARGDDVPFAQPGLSGSPAALSDIMAGVQLRHIKLWQAIKARNFPLVAFETTLIAESLREAAMLYRNIPIDSVLAATTPLVALKDAATAKDPAGLAAHFDQLTAACNACHVAAEIGFVKITRPSALPFSNQDFAPGK